MEFKFITDEPVLVIGDRLVIADLHIGIEYEYWKSGVKIPSYLEKTIPKLEKLIKKNRIRKLLILGDVKHKVPGTSWQEIKELPYFLRHFAKLTELEIIPGNHDDQIEKYMIKGIKIHPRNGILIDGIYFTHGHTWPSKDFLKAKYLVMGHVHPGIEFKSELGYRWVESVWLRGELDPEKIREKYDYDGKLPEVIIMPNFNHYTGAVALNKPKEDIELQYYESPGPLMKSLNLTKSRIYLLDGTFLGELGKL